MVVSRPTPSNKSSLMGCRYVENPGISSSPRISGLVGSAICRRLAQDPDAEVITRSRVEVDLTDRRAVDAFYAETRPEQHRADLDELRLPEPTALVSSPIHLDTLLRSGVKPRTLGRILTATAPLSRSMEFSVPHGGELPGRPS